MVYAIPTYELRSTPAFGRRRRLPPAAAAMLVITKFFPIITDLQLGTYLFDKTIPQGKQFCKSVRNEEYILMQDYSDTDYTVRINDSCEKMSDVNTFIISSAAQEKSP